MGLMFFGIEAAWIAVAIGAVTATIGTTNFD
jgi:hypothetical protein